MLSIYLPVTKYEKYKSLRVWEQDNPYITCDKILVSPFTTGMDKAREDFKNPKLTIYADSGGYQIATLGKRVRAMDVLGWQELIADIGFTVDVPPHAFNNGNYTRGQFLKCMNKSNKNAHLMWKLKQTNMKLWGVIQGRTYEECELWFNDLTKEHEYSGYCVTLSIHKSKHNLPYIEQLEFAKTILKPIHFFGYSDNIFALILAKFSRLMKQTYTFDSSTSTIGDRYAKYIHPNTFKHISFSLKERPLDKLSCDCPICSKHSVTDLRYNLSLINLHNLFIKIKFCEFANQVAQDDDLFLYILQEEINRKTQYKKGVISKILPLFYGRDIPVIPNKLENKYVPSIVKEYLFWHKLK
ncbi:MAG: hypothetical protein KAW45_02840 [Thermoplasmatales archaeon]|nr:hypothetical protein [Thermoplasmatales archaeon]